ncbi:MAG: polymer-forming cytoskeletal protein, partial [Burkholderiaceae bacterium]|nr:polymer-forming cytoskeletal protein [Burkholderiaceae bacterium]
KPVVNETVLPTGWKLTGEIEVAGPLRVGGTLNGTAVQQSFGSTVTVEQSGSVIGDIVADAIEIQGSFDGHIDASGGSIVIEKTARMKGKISYTNIRMSGGQHQIELVHVPQSRETRDQDTEA